MAVLTGIDADVYVAANPSTALVTHEHATDSGDHITYTMDTHRYWDKRVTLTVQTAATLEGSYGTVTDYTFEYAGGIIVFDTARDINNRYVRVNAGNYFLVTQCGDCSDWSLDMTADSSDTTTFQSEWQLNTTHKPNGTVRISSFRVDDLLASELNNLLALVLYVDHSAGTRWEMLAYVTAVTPKSTFAGIVDQAITFRVEGPAYFRST